MKKAVVLMGIVMMIGNAMAADQFWGVQSGDFADSESWIQWDASPGSVPGSGDHGRIGNGGTAEVSTDFTGSGPNWVSILGSSTLEIVSGGNLVLTDSLILGGNGWMQTNTGPGTLIIREGGSIYTPNIYVGDWGNVTDASIAEQHGGTMTVTNLTVGNQLKGEYHLYGGTIEPRGENFVNVGWAQSGDGLFVQHPGTSVKWLGWSRIGHTGKGEYRLLGGTMEVGGYAVLIGSGSTGDGKFIQSDGYYGRPQYTTKLYIGYEGGDRSLPHQRRQRGARWNDPRMEQRRRHVQDQRLGDHQHCSG